MTGAHPTALSTGQSTVRLLVELAALVCWAVAGWQIGGESSFRWPLAIGLPVVAAAVWGTFRVPGDQSANGEAVVPVSGKVRFVIEMGVLLGAALTVGATGRPILGAALALVASMHYSTTPRRTAWLWAQA